MSEERIADKLLRKLYENTVNNGIESIDKGEIGKRNRNNRCANG